MSFLRFVPNEPTGQQELVDRVAEELRQASPPGESPADAPAIIEEQVPHSPRFYVTVIWDGWEPVERQARGHIIMDAYQQVRGLDETLNISAVLGLTHQEADRLGVGKILQPV